MRARSLASRTTPNGPSAPIALLALLALAAAACGGNADASRRSAAPVAEAWVAPPDCRPTVMPEGSLGHQHMSDPDRDRIAVLDETRCSLLESQLAAARDAAARTPTVRDAQRAGYERLGFYAPGVAAHYVKQSIYDDRFDPSQPEFLLYDGIEPQSRLVGLSYAMRQREDPEMFMGPNDQPHRHAWCPAPEPGAEAREPGDPGCTERNAQGADEWMIHAWVVPGRASPYGVFSPINPYISDKGWDPSKPVAPVDAASMAEARAQVEARLAAGGGPLPGTHDHHGGDDHSGHHASGEPAGTSPEGRSTP